jgi:RNA polymerase sigma-70 factor, ECF subfamily
MSQTVEQALKLIREDRPESIDQALALLQNTVYSFSMKVCGHPQDAEDTMQDVLLKSVPHLAKFDNPQALSVWLYKVARNRCVSSRRGKFSPARNLSLDELMPHSHELRELQNSAAPNPEAALLNSESAEHLKQAVLAVPPQYRMVARLFVRQHLAKLAKARPDTGLIIHAAAEEPRPLRCRRLFAALSDYMDGVIDDAMCDQMDRHLHDCEPCVAFLDSLKSAVKQCRSYRPECNSVHATELREELLHRYRAAVAALPK